MPRYEVGTRVKNGKTIGTITGIDNSMLGTTYTVKNDDGTQYRTNAPWIWKLVEEE
jgi:hypothetical protein